MEGRQGPTDWRLPLTPLSTASVESATPRALELHSLTVSPTCRLPSALFFIPPSLAHALQVLQRAIALQRRFPYGEKIDDTRHERIFLVKNFCLFVLFGRTMYNVVGFVFNWKQINKKTSFEGETDERNKLKREKEVCVRKRRLARSRISRQPHSWFVLDQAVREREEYSFVSY